MHEICSTSRLMRYAYQRYLHLKTDPTNPMRSMFYKICVRNIFDRVEQTKEFYVNIDDKKRKILFYAVKTHRTCSLSIAQIERGLKSAKNRK